MSPFTTQGDLRVGPCRVTGPDGPSHHGMWDLSILQVVPRIRIAAPRDAKRRREELAEAVAIDDAPTVIRFPKGSVSPEIQAVREPTTVLM